MTVPFNENSLTPSSTVQAAQFVYDAGTQQWVPLTVAAGDPTKVAATVSVANPTLKVEGKFFPDVQPVTITNLLQPAKAIEVSNLHDDQLVHASGGFYPATQVITGEVVVSNMPAPVTKVEISNFPAQVPVTSVEVSNFPEQKPVEFPSTYAVTGQFWPDVTKVQGKFFPDVQSVAGTVEVSNFPEFPASIETRQHVLDPETGQWVPSEVPTSSGSQSMNKVQLVQITQAPPLVVQGQFWQNVQPTQDSQAVELLKQILAALQAKP